MELRGISWSAAALVWGAAVIGFWGWTTRYEFATGSHDGLGSKAQWPAESVIVPADDRPTLLFFVHPRCPCTRASVAELERLLAGRRLQESQQPKLVVVASLPADASSQWREAGPLRRAAELPRAETCWDVKGIETSRFGATTSGTVMLYSRGGSLLFSGGITSSRGHEGGSAGGESLAALLTGDADVPHESTPVFGCELCVEPVAGEVGGSPFANQPPIADAQEGTNR